MLNFIFKKTINTSGCLVKGKVFVTQIMMFLCFFQMIFIPIYLEMILIVLFIYFFIVSGMLSVKHIYFKQYENTLVLASGYLFANPVYKYSLDFCGHPLQKHERGCLFSGLKGPHPSNLK